MDAGLLKTLGEVLGIGGGRARGLLPPVPRSYSEIDFPDAEEGRCIPAPAIDLHIGLVGGGDWCRSLVLGRSKGANKFNHDDRTTKPGCSGNEGRCEDRLQYTSAESQVNDRFRSLRWLSRLSHHLAAFRDMFATVTAQTSVANANATSEGSNYRNGQCKAS